MKTNDKLKEIENFLEMESSILERGKRYKEDVGILLSIISDLRLKIFHMKPISTANVSLEHSLKLLQEILTLVRKYDNSPIAC